MVRPSGLTATEHMGDELVIVAGGRPAAMSQTRMVRSIEPETISPPSG
jgi:hypothetical protein